MENPFKRLFADAPVDLNRRQMLKVAIPGGWIPELVRNKHLSRTGQLSLWADLILLNPSLLIACAGSNGGILTDQPEIERSISIPPSFRVEKNAEILDLDYVNQTL